MATVRVLMDVSAPGPRTRVPEMHSRTVLMLEYSAKFLFILRRCTYKYIRLSPRLLLRVEMNRALL